MTGDLQAEHAAGDHPLRAGQRIAYDHYVKYANSEQPLLVACIGRGELLAGPGQLPGIGPYWVVDDDEEGSDFPVPVSHLWPDEHPSVSRYRGPIAHDFLVGQLIADVERAIRAPDSHTAFDVGLCLVTLSDEVINLGERCHVDRAEVEVARDGDRCLDVSGTAFIFGPDVRDENNYTFVQEALAARIDLDKGVLRVKLIERDGEWQHDESVALSALRK